MAVMAQSGCVVMGVKSGTVFYYRKCNHCQNSEFKQPYKEAPWQESGISSQGDYKCHKCGQVSKVDLKFFKL